MKKDIFIDLGSGESTSQIDLGGKVCRRPTIIDKTVPNDNSTNNGKYDPIKLGDTARDIWLKAITDNLQKQIDEISLGIGALAITQNDNGDVEIELLNKDYESFDPPLKGTITLTEKIIKEANLDYENSKIVFVCNNNDEIELDISDIVDAIHSGDNKSIEVNSETELQIKDFDEAEIGSVVMKESADSVKWVKTELVAVPNEDDDYYCLELQLN